MPKLKVQPSSEKGKVTHQEAVEAADDFQKNRLPRIHEVEQLDRKAKEEAFNKKMGSHQEEAWKQAKEDCSRLRQLNQSYSDLVSVIVAQFALVSSMSKVSHPKASYYMSNLPELAKDILGWAGKKVKGKQQPEESITISRDQDGKMSTNYTIGGKQVEDPEAMRVVNTLALSYLQSKGYNLNENDQVIHGEGNKKGQPVDSKEFEKLSEGFAKEFKSFIKDITAKRDEEPDIAEDTTPPSFRP